MIESLCYLKDKKYFFKINKGQKTLIPITSHMYLFCLLTLNNINIYSTVDFSCYEGLIASIKLNFIDVVSFFI